MTTIHAADETTLDRIASAVHDWWFDLDVVRSQTALPELLVALYAESPRQLARRWLAPGLERERANLPSARARLVIGQVERFDVDDHAEVGWYDLGRIDFDASSNTIRLVSNLPLVVTVRVGRLDVSLSEWV